MRSSIPDRLATSWCRELGPFTVYLPYLRRQLWRKGLRHPSRLLEGLDIVVQQFALVRLHRGELPTGWRARRAILDRAVYQAVRELSPCGSAAVDLDTLPNPAVGRGQAAEGDRGRRLGELVERLPAPRRLVVKLKLADLFFPGRTLGDFFWKSDEADYLLEQHPGRSLADLNAELNVRIGTTALRRRRRVPSAVIAWLLGRASADAVDTAFRDIKEQLRDAAPEGAAGVSKPTERPLSHRHISSPTRPTRPARPGARAPRRSNSPTVRVNSPLPRVLAAVLRAA